MHHSGFILLSIYVSIMFGLLLVFGNQVKCIDLIEVALSDCLILNFV